MSTETQLYRMRTPQSVGDPDFRTFNYNNLVTQLLPYVITSMIYLKNNCVSRIHMKIRAPKTASKCSSIEKR